MFNSVLTSTTSAMDMTQVLICLAASVVCGLIVSLIYRLCEKPSKSFSMTLVLLPAIVQLVIMMVNGNLGVGVAVAGSFSLVKFRSLPGKASDILVIFLAMGLGLATGMGYVVFAVAAALIISLIYLVLSKTNLLSEDSTYRNIRISIPEDLNYVEVFDEVFGKYAKNVKLESVRTINLGTMYQIEYSLNLKNAGKEKDMIDELRIRNSNLPIVSSHMATVAAEL